jgi:hypothetical protein
MRCLSSSFDDTRIWRSIERAILEKNPSTMLSHEPCFGVNTKAKRPSGWAATQGLGLLRDLLRVIVEDQPNGGVRRIGGIKLLEEGDELAQAVSIFDTACTRPASRSIPGQQTENAVALVFVVARECHVRSGLRRQIGCRVTNGLDARLLVIGDDRDVCRRAFALLYDGDLAIDAEHLGHLRLKGLPRRSR